MANKQMQTIGIIVIIVVVLAIIGILILSSGSSKGSGYTTVPAGSTTIQSSASSASTGTYPILLSDPQQVPRGTSALIIGYSSVQAHVAGGSWAQAQGSGTINLTAIQNQAQVIALANLSSNANIDMVRFSITSAQIIINGTTYDVQVQSPQVAAQVYSNTSAPGVLVEITPAVIPLYSNVNGTTFILAPSLSAVPATNVSTSASLGSRTSLSSSAMAQLSGVSSQLQVATAQLSYVNSSGTGTLSITIRNNGHQPAVLQNVYLYGNQSIKAVAAGSPTIGISALVPGTTSNVSIINGAPVDFQLTSQTNASVTALVEAGVAASDYQMLPFQVNSNGNMQLINSKAVIGGSYAIPPQSSATLTFSGSMSASGGYLQFKPIGNKEYTIVVQGMNGTVITANATATVLH